MPTQRNGMIGIVGPYTVGTSAHPTISVVKNAVQNILMLITPTVY